MAAGVPAAESIQVALRRGATGVHVDAWATRDGHVVVSRRGLVRRFPRRKVHDVDVGQLPADFLRIEELYEATGTDTPVSVGVDAVETGERVVAAARAAGAAPALWLGHPDLDVLAGWRDHAPEIRLVNTTELSRMPTGAERRAAELAAGRIDAVCLPEPDWTGGMVTLFHRFEVLAFAAGAQYERQLARVIDMGVDGVIGEHVDRMVAVADTFG